MNFLVRCGVASQHLFGSGAFLMSVVSVSVAGRQSTGVTTQQLWPSKPEFCAFYCYSECEKAPYKQKNCAPQVF